MKRALNILIACEESQTVCKAFRELGQNAYSCDLLPCSGEHPEWHFNHDVRTVLDKTDLTLQSGEQAHINGEWDIMIGHPPCTYLSVSGAQWYYHPADKDLPTNLRRPHPKFPNRANDREDGVNFFLSLANANVKRIAIENPVGIMSTRWRKPDQTVQPYMFGDSFSKGTCLWLKNLRPLHPSKETDNRGEWVVFASGKKLPKWYADALAKAKTPEERRTLRSKTFPGIARAMAEQWTIQIAFDEKLLDERELRIIGDDYNMLDRYETEQLGFVEEREQHLINYWKTGDELKSEKFAEEFTKKVSETTEAESWIPVKDMLKTYPVVYKEGYNQCLKEVCNWLTQNKNNLDYIELEGGVFGTSLIDDLKKDVE